MTTTGSTTSCSSNRRMARGSASNTLVSSTYVRTAELDPRLPVEAATSVTLRPKGVLQVYDTPGPGGTGLFAPAGGRHIAKHAGAFRDMPTLSAAGAGCGRSRVSGRSGARGR